MTWGNIIYFPKDQYNSDGTISQRSWLIHELTHVMQYQSGEWYRTKSVYEQIFTDAYDYDLSSGKSFCEYGVEQRAQIMGDFWMDHLLGRDISKYLPIIKGIIPSNYWSDGGSK